MDFKRLLILSSMTAVSFLFGILVLFRESTVNEIAVNETKSSRDPAAIGKNYDFSSLDGEALSKASKARLLSDMRFIEEAEVIGLELGHFVVKGSDGTRKFACDKFSQLKLTFSGEGSASGGEKATLELTSPCEVANDINRINPIWIPFKRLMREPARDGEFSFQGPQQISIKTKNLSSTWPELWALSRLEMSGTNEGSDQLIVEEAELATLTSKPILLNFKSGL